jgi:hypothetical protein
MAFRPPILCFLALVLGATALQAQEASGGAGTPSVSVVVPVVGSVEGPGNGRWRTEVDLHNAGRADTTVALMLPTAPDQPVFITTLAGGQTMHFGDVVTEAFGLDGALSPLVVQTMGRRSVSIRANAYCIEGTDTSEPQPISISYGTTFYPIRVLYGLSFSDSYRTNIGLANLGEKEAAFTLALQRIPGRPLAVTHVTVPASSLGHASSKTLFPLITDGDDFSVMAETSSGDTYVYASVIQNGTNLAKFIDPRVGVNTGIQSVASVK